MKGFIYVAILAAMVASGHGSPIDSIILGKAEDLRPYLKDLEIPRINISEINYAENIKLHNFETFALYMESTLIPMKLKNMTLKLDNCNVKGYYHLEDLNLLPGMEVFGDGQLDVTLNQIELTMAASLTRCPDIPSDKTAACLKDITLLHVGLGSVQIFLENIMGGGAISDLLNTLLTNTVPDLVTSIDPVLLDYLEKPLIENLNKVLSKIFI